MNTSKTISSGGSVGGDHFELLYVRTSNKYLSDYITLFNHNDYHILKSTHRQRLVTYEEFINFPHSSYIFYRKDTYDIDHILLWVEMMNGMGITFLHKPLPPFSPDKVIIRK